MLFVLITAAGLAQGEICPQTSARDAAQCWTTVAFQSNDPSFCARIDGDSDQQDCYAAVARLRGNVSCGDISYQFGHNDCTEQGRVGTAELAERQAQARRLEEDRQRSEDQLEAAEAMREQQADLAAQADEQRAILEEQLAEQVRLRESLEAMAPKATPVDGETRSDEAAASSELGDEAGNRSR